ncbi:MAG: helix-turn-helix family protein [Anaerocolumna sp.]|nr:helix-turn-helix family protein [Anaerocolumna sp.]
MSESLGNKIKRLRKELKMTQTELAGKEMTKSMISQIENNTAMPSMKNLQHLAEKLGKSPSYFLDNTLEYSNIMIDEIRNNMKKAANLFEQRKYEESFHILDEIGKNYNIDRESRLYADYLSKYGECCIELNRLKESEEKLNEAITIYKNHYLYIDAAKTYLLLIGVPWNEFNYVRCLEILEEANKVYDYSINQDYSFEIESLYLRAIINAGLDNLVESMKATEEALEISKRTKIYYRSDELYKIMAVFNAFMDNFEHFDEYLMKAMQFATFTENQITLSSIESIIGKFKNQSGDPGEAIVHLQKSLQISDITAPHTYSELAKSYYMLGDYYKAIDSVKQIVYPIFTPFKYDYLMIWSAKIYEGLSLMNLGSYFEGIEALKYGIEKMEVIKESKTLALAYRSLSEVYSKTGNFEEAFTALKRGNEIEEIAKNKNIYY